MNAQPTNIDYSDETWHICNETELESCILNANCYSYALDRPEYYWSIPGIGYMQSDRKTFLDYATTLFDQFQNHEEFAKFLISGAQKDGLEIARDDRVKPNSRLAALFISKPGDSYDFHWYRKDNEKSWSHKDGWRPPSNLDASGVPIFDPTAITETAYPIFVSYFYVPNSGVKLTEIKTFNIEKTN